MKKLLIAVALLLTLSTTFMACEPDTRPANTSAKDEQAHTELNQRNLLVKQPPPTIDWSLERDNLRKRMLLQNDRTVMFYMYVFIQGVAQPVGYYQVNKVSSVNSQLTNTMQLVRGDLGDRYGDFVLPSPAEDGSYGENGNGVFGFTPDDVYIETNMLYIVSSIPLKFKDPVTMLAVVTTDEMKSILSNSKKAMSK